MKNWSKHKQTISYLEIILFVGCILVSFKPKRIIAWVLAAKMQRHDVSSRDKNSFKSKRNSGHLSGAVRCWIPEIHAASWLAKTSVITIKQGFSGRKKKNNTKKKPKTMVQPLQGSEVALGGIEIFFFWRREKGNLSQITSSGYRPSSTPVFVSAFPIDSATQFLLKPNVSFWKEGSMFIRKLTRGDKHCEAMLFK